MTKKSKAEEPSGSSAESADPEPGYHCPLCGEDGPGLMEHADFEAHIKQEHPGHIVEWTEHGHGLVHQLATKKPKGVR
jgi:hypothetical protein